MSIRMTVAGLLFVLPTLFSSPAFAGDEPAIDGYCPVGYVAAGKALKGDPKFAVKADGETYWFVSKDAKKAFKKTPEKFDVAYDGWCATGIAMGKKIPVDPKMFSVVDGKIYLFSNAETKAMFDNDPSLASKADTAWKTL